MTYKKVHSREEFRRGHFDIQVSDLEHVESREHEKDCLLNVLGAWGLYRREMSRTDDPENVEP